MNHPEDKLAAYVDGELGHEAREKVLAHLAQCAECRAEAEEQRRVKALLAQSRTPAPSTDLMARLLALGAGDGGPGGEGEEAAPPRVPGAVAPLTGRVPVAPPRPRGATGPRQGRPNNAPARVRPPVTRRRLTFAAAGAFSVMAMALSSAVLTNGPAGGSAGRPAAPVVERNLVEQAGTFGAAATQAPETLQPAALTGQTRPLADRSPTEVPTGARRR
ncbi:anti-sigma factor family protein [Yinghuangia seranimata]|uniref:anti-sigma factor family protein n=1 Tax=Yinghuangia seranimata TaxID=408067 RepID=UPI00248AF617|nr:zf-HC2 domain-containing protein [Yinghuangia seranimata]MDI2128948.1 zf-HC2 domain-containing protein [Yinghuangia seranimata]